MSNEAAVEKVVGTILESSVRNGATHVDVTTAAIILFRGETRLGVAKLPDGIFPDLVAKMRSMAKFAEGAQEGEVRFSGPSGDLTTLIGFGEGDAGFRLTLSHDPEAARAEAIVHQTFEAMDEMNADLAIITEDGIAFAHHGEEVGVADLPVGSFGPVLALARSLAKVPHGEGEGIAFPYGGDETVPVSIAILAREGRVGIMFRIPHDHEHDDQESA
jgi:hypothetical protein